MPASTPPIVSKASDAQALARKWRQTKKSIGFVPTMGALHEGHLELARACRKQNGVTVVSIYVNPLQFGPQEDFNQYPRVLEKDLELLKKEKVHLVYAPSDREMYPRGFSTEVKVKGDLVKGLCAPFRPGHFDGVSTVVVKLLGAVQPDRLYLGQKDAQQVAVLKRVIQDLNMGVETVVCPIVREHDGLAMSSRNQRLTLEGRKIAPVLYKALKVGKSIVELGETRAEKVLEEIKKVIEDERKVKLQYLEAVKAESLDPVEEIKPGTMIALAAYLDNVRLIDNIIL
jgi:pantoate--beta-alanine ligase